MKRTKNKKELSAYAAVQLKKIQMFERVAGVRSNLASMMGRQYKGVRNVYESLGYPEESDLTYTYYFGKYRRDPIASAIIDRPADKTWTGDIQLLEENTAPVNSKLSKEWREFNEQFKAKLLLKKLDKIACLGNYALVLFGFDDVKKVEDFKVPAIGKKKLLYLRTISEDNITITKWEENTSSPRYGKPLFYEVKSTKPGKTTKTEAMEIHHSRVLHVNTEALDSEILGRPMLEPVINRIIDIEKLLGGDAEMFWRGARPGYTALSQPDYSMGDAEMEALEAELTKYEHDLRRFITAQGVDIKALEQQVADPLNHLDAQLQAISAQTGIPKRILIGSERGELSSAQDKNEWLALIKTRQEEMSEPIILRPFINMCMEFGILTKVTYSVFWEDVFAPSEKDKVEIGKSRAEALKIYNDSLGASDILPHNLANKYLLGFTPEQILEIEEAITEVASSEDGQMARIEAELVREAQEAANGKNNGNPTVE